MPENEEEKRKKEEICENNKRFLQELG